jgi:mannose-6-phosphate isomerase-like protein (cupin superfamily)
VVERLKFNLESDHLRLRPDSSIEPLTLGAEFWPQLMSGKLGDFHHEYLVTINAYDRDWPSWECHPNGDEIVLLLSGRVTMVLETPTGEERVELAATGDYVRIPRDTWHTSKTSTPTKMLFITAGEGTKIRPLADPA